MIPASEIDAQAKLLNLTPQDVERDYVHGWILKEIYEHSVLSNLLVLKGGSGLRKGYLSDTRFSKDLDFSCEVEIDQRQLEEDLAQVLRAASKGSGVEFCIDDTHVRDKKLQIPGVSALEARIYFKGFYQRETLKLRSHLDINQFDKIYLPIQSRPLLHPYSDMSACSGLIKCQKLEEILASKLTTLLHRRRAQDLFDLAFSILFNRGFEVSRAEVIRTFLKKSIYDPQARQARSDLLQVPLNVFKDLWGSIIVPVTSRLDFDSVQGQFQPLIDGLFRLLEPDLGGDQIRSYSGNRSYQGPSTYGFGGGFSHEVRQVIIGSGLKLTMIEAEYQGHRRLLEPYKIEYKVRKSDNRGFEYFWAYDRIGGKSGPGIKCFFSDQLSSITPTTLTYEPRFDVEF